MKQKPINPYTRLRNSIIEFCNKLNSNSEKFMFNIPKARLHEGWRLDDVYERTVAAKQIGYEVILTADPNGLNIKYRKIIPVPSRYSWR